MYPDYERDLTNLISYNSRQTFTPGHRIQPALAPRPNKACGGPFQPQGLDQPAPVRDRDLRIQAAVRRVLPVRHRCPRPRPGPTTDPLERRWDVSLDGRRPCQGQHPGQDLPPESGRHHPDSGWGGLRVQPLLRRHSPDHRHEPQEQIQSWILKRKKYHLLKCV